jgi:peptidoglycan/xylan/chitin deacetylase (PgdA/CDA1 family)
MVQKIAYLTIDDAPSAHMGRKIDYLSRNNSPAVFFCEGAKMEQRPEPVIDAMQQGFIIGNHSYSHPHFSEITLEQASDEIKRTDDVIEALYRQAGVARPGRYFRFPFGDKGALPGEYPLGGYSAAGAARKEKIQAILRSLGYTQPAFPKITYHYFREAGLPDDADWFWTYDTFDWSVFAEEPMYGIDSLEALFARMDEDNPEGTRGLNDPGSEDIILIHDHEISTENFFLTVDRLAAKGLQFRLPAIGS